MGPHNPSKGVFGAMSTQGRQNSAAMRSAMQKCSHCTNTDMLCKASIERKNREVESIHLENMRLRATLGARDKEIKSLRDATLDVETRAQLEAKDRDIAQLTALVKKLQGGRPMLHRRVPSSHSHLSDHTDVSWSDAGLHSESWSEVGSELDDNISEPPRSPVAKCVEAPENHPNGPLNQQDLNNSMIEERMLVPPTAPIEAGGE